MPENTAAPKEVVLKEAPNFPFPRPIFLRSKDAKNMLEQAKQDWEELRSGDEEMRTARQ